MRSQATFLANDVLERLRLNRISAVTGNCNLAFGASPPNPPNALTNCTAALRSDLGDWKDAVKAALPDGDGSLSVNSSGTAVITVQWDEDGDSVVTSFSTRSVI